MADVNTNACEWYLVNVVFDTTVRTVIALLLLRLSIRVLLKYPHLDPKGHLMSGEYGRPINYFRWAKQLLMWICIVAVSRSIVAGFVVCGHGVFGEVGRFLLRPMCGHPEQGIGSSGWFAKILANAAQNL